MGEDLILLSTAARRVGITPEYLLVLGKRGIFTLVDRRRIWSLRPRWYVTRASIETWERQSGECST